eukprot:CFRG2508T1
MKESMPWSYFNDNVKCIITGYLGGVATSIRLHAVDPSKIGLAESHDYNNGKLLYEETYSNHRYGTFIQMVEAFLGQSRRDGVMVPRIHVACFAVSGPVDSNQVTFSNRSMWVIDVKTLERHLNIDKIVLTNDFVSAGYSVLTLSERETVTIQDAQPLPGAPICVLGAGTGLGQCYLTAREGEVEYTVWPSEGGHCEFAPRTPQEVELLQFLKSKYNEDFRVSVERIVSMKGLVNVYEFLTCHAKHHSTSEEGKLGGRGQHGNMLSRSEAILKRATEDSASSTALDILISTYGAEAGCAALKWLPYGGLYVIGTIVQRRPDLFTESDTFMTAFKDKGRVSPTIANIPVKLVMADDLIIRGCYFLAIKTLRTLENDRTMARSFILTKDSLLRFSTLCVTALSVGVLIWKSVRQSY